MPLNEASGYRRSYLTKEQKRQAEAAIYGHPEQMNDNNLTEFSPQDIDRMRAILAQHDRQTMPTREFDLNKPPVKPYFYQEFPRMVYHLGRGINAIVQHEAELAAMLAGGWQTTPIAAEQADAELDPAAAAEAAEIDKQLIKKKK